jgi:hypothetical protein
MAAGTRFKLGREIVELTGGTASFIFPSAPGPDAVAEILAASAGQEGDPTQVNNLVLNAAVLQRQIVAGASKEGGYDAGTALDVTYGPRGERKYTTRGLAPVLVPAGTLVPNAAPTRLQVDLDQNISSVLNNYLLGFTCKVAGVNRVINSAARQADNSIIWLTLASGVTTGQAVLVSFDPSLSDIVSATGAKPAAFTDAVVINQT